MNTTSSCQSCRRTADSHLLDYRKGSTVLHQDSLLQCDVCERYACSECLQVYEIVSGYDFLCHDCARGFGDARGH